MARGLVLVNPHSGTNDMDLDELRSRFAEHDVEECEPAAIGARVRTAVHERRPFVGIAGGDGTIRGAAAVLAGTDVALLPIPAGTRNHFAIELGITTLDDALLAAKAGRAERIDVGRVNGKVFVNNSSVGLYPRLVEQRELREQRLPKAWAGLAAIFHQLRAGRRITVDIDGRAWAAWLVFVGNGCYGETVSDLASRESLHDNVLDVRLVRADQRFARLRLIAALLFGRLARTPVMERRTCRAITIELGGRRVARVALDGEIEKLTTPLRYESVADAMLVLVPDSG